MDWIGLGPITVIYKITSFSVHFPFSALKDVAYYTAVFMYFSVLTNIDYLHCHGVISYQHATLTAQMESNSETYLMMFSPIES